MGTGSFGNADLGDRRRTNRLVKVAADFRSGACCGGGGTICSVIPSVHQAKAAYRLLDCEQVTHPAVLGGHFSHVRERLTEPGVVLLIEDTTALEYHSMKQARGLGPIGESFTRGYWLHSTLAVRWDEDGDAMQILGLAHQQAWARPVKRPADRRKSNGRGKESNHARQKRSDRESKRWGAVLPSLPVAADGSRRIYVADRESDIYEVFQGCQLAGVSSVIRAAHPRALAGALSDQNLMSAAAQGELLGVIEVEHARENRTAKLEIRSVTVELRGPPRPAGRLANRTLNVVQAKEIDPPNGKQPLNWTLLTDLPVQTFKQCQRILGIYRHRWLIEEFHKALKTGLGIEQSQLSDYRRLSSLAGVVSVIAVFLLQTKWQAKTSGDEVLDTTLVNTHIVKILQKLHPIKGKPTRRWFWFSIAKLGGFLGRKGDGHPGWLTLWRGWQTLMHLLRGYELRIE